MRLPAIIERDRTFSRPIVWITTLFMTAFHIGAVAALFVFSPPTGVADPRGMKRV